MAKIAEMLNCSYMFENISEMPENLVSALPDYLSYGIRESENAPVWAGKIATPALSYIKQNAEKLGNVKLFMTAMSDDFNKSFAQAEKYSVKPVKTLGLTTKQVKRNDFNLDSFLE